MDSAAAPSPPDRPAAAAPVVLAFTAPQVVRLTGLTARQLASWDRDGFFAPQLAADDRRSPYARIYGFKDVVGLRTLAILRNAHKVPMAHLRDVARRLSTKTASPWSDRKLWVLKRRVQFEEPGSGAVRGVLDGQFAMLAIIDVEADVARDAAQLRERDPATVGRIDRHRHVAGNAPVIAGTRIRVAAVRSFLDAGYSPAQVIEQYPSLTQADVAAVQHAEAARLAA